MSYHLYPISKRFLHLTSRSFKAFIWKQSAWDYFWHSSCFQAKVRNHRLGQGAKSQNAHGKLVLSISEKSVGWEAVFLFCESLGDFKMFPHFTLRWNEALSNCEGKIISHMSLMRKYTMEPRDFPNEEFFKNIFPWKVSVLLHLRSLMKNGVTVKFPTASNCKCFFYCVWNKCKHLFFIC